ncbi:hypothetical protein B5C26_20745 [Photorhabdus luminescens]|uniref:RHS repeat-associated core domain-containing protein n=1 Tax=Photorhabdus luminescens TaxID=29488 RepID=UPI000B4CD4D7|nr:RHS repeat-associated core domain-containing protein [Photorhabdus luminescens]OWO79597.1 hypothetical protein B5C26_20745 [Photorhabdus luminescens]
MTFYHTGVDMMDSVLMSLDPNSGQQQNVCYSAYGAIAQESNNDLPGFNGERRDPISGTTHLGNGYRAYNPTLMRFNSPDSFSPFGAGGLNPYAYCDGDPINNSDPSGHMSTQAGIGLGLGIFGLVLGIFTFGASIAAVAAAETVTVSMGAAIVGSGLGIAASATSIASASLEDTDPHASEILGWVSLGLGIAGAVASVTGAVSEAASSAGGDMRGPAFSKSSKNPAPTVPQDFQSLVDPQVSFHSKQWIDNRNHTGRNWHSISFAGKEIYGSDTPITASDLDHPIRMIESNPNYNGKPILILTASHGDRLGFNWDANINGGRRTDLHEILFFNEDRDDRKGSYNISKQVHIKDIRNSTYQDMQSYINSPDYNLILGYCFGRNDQALRFYTGAGPVTSYTY